MGKIIGIDLGTTNSVAAVMSGGEPVVDRGTTALALIQSGERFDLLLTDIVMPEMDGIELAQKASVIDPNLRVMFITGFSAVTLRAGQALPNAKVLSKPFHLKDLVLEVDRVFEVGSMSGLS